MSSSCLPMKADNLVCKLLIYTAGLAYLAIRFFETSTDCCTQSADDYVHSVSVIIYAFGVSDHICIDESPL